MYDYEKWREKQELDFYEDRREIEKTRAKAVVKEQVKMQAQECREARKEQEDERKKSVYEEVQVLQSGELQIVTKNLRIDAIPRKVTNMENPRVIMLRRMRNGDDELIMVKCNVKDSDIKIFMAPSMIGSGSYVLKKFAAKGIDFSMPTAKAKRLATCLVIQLSAEPERIQWLPEHAGWVQNLEGNFEFFGKEQLTWQKAQKLAN